MKTALALCCVALLLAGCASDSPATVAQAGKPQPADRAMRPGQAGGPAAASLNAYRQEVARRITAVNAGKVYPGRPQALLRSVVVVRYSVNSQGKLLHAGIMRSNRDRVTEAAALASLRKAAPYPKPSPDLLHHGRVDLAETWLFNNDGRFQLRTVAQPQMDR